MKSWLFVVVSGILHPILISSENDPDMVVSLYVKLTSDHSTLTNVLIPVGNSRIVNVYILTGRALELPYPFFVVNSVGEMFFVNSYEDYITREESFV